MKAPNFKLSSTSGKIVELSKVKSKFIIIYFYPKDNTPGCTKEACLLRDDYSKIKSLNANIIGINSNSTASHKNFQAKHKLPFSLLSDPEGFTSEKYDALFQLFFIKFSKRRSFVIDPQGIVKKIYTSVNPSIHAKEITNDLQLLQRKN